MLGALFIELLKIFWHLATFDHSGTFPYLGVASMLIISNCCILLFRLLIFSFCMVIRNWLIPGLLPSCCHLLDSLRFGLGFRLQLHQVFSGFFFIVLLAFAFWAFIGEEVTPGALLAAALALPAAFALALDFAFTLALAFAFSAAVSKNSGQLMGQFLLEKPVLQILVLFQVEAKCKHSIRWTGLFMRIPAGATSDK